MISDTYNYNYHNIYLLCIGSHSSLTKSGNYPLVESKEPSLVVDKPVFFKDLKSDKESSGM